MLAELTHLQLTIASYLWSTSVPQMFVQCSYCMDHEATSWFQMDRCGSSFPFLVPAGSTSSSNASRVDMFFVLLHFLIGLRWASSDVKIRGNCDWSDEEIMFVEVARFLWRWGWFCAAHASKVSSDRVSCLDVPADLLTVLCLFFMLWWFCRVS